jgi:preprotein translocase SecE subunit
MARSARRGPRSEGRRTLRGRGRDAGETPPPTGNGAGETTVPATSPSTSPARTTRVAPAAPRRRLPRIRRLLPRAVADIWSELRKVTWPSLEDTRYLTIVVSIVAVSVGIFLGGIDLLFGWMIEQVFFS